MTHLQDAINHLKNDGTFELINDKNIFINALVEIEYRLAQLEKK